MATPEVKVKATLEDDVSSNYKKMTENVKSDTENLTSTLKDMAKAVVGLFALDKIKDALVGSAKAAGEAQMQQAKLVSVLNATRSASGQTVKGLNDLSEAIQKNTIYDNDAAIAAETLLLTFNRISGETFPEAIRTAADMATVFGGDLTSNTQMLGKALQDPIMGMNLLRRQGIIFTEEQKKLVEGFVKTNNVASAQKVILDKLKDSIGGSAEAAGNTGYGAWIKMQNALADVSKQIGNELLPYMTKFAKWVTDNSATIANAIIGLGKIVGGTFQLIVGSIDMIIAGFLKGVDFLINTVVSAFNRILELGSKVADLLPGDIGKSKIDALRESIQGFSSDLAKVPFENARKFMLSGGAMLESGVAQFMGNAPATVTPETKVRTGGKPPPTGPSDEDLAKQRENERKAEEKRLQDAIDFNQKRQDIVSASYDNIIATVANSFDRQRMVSERAENEEIQRFLSAYDQKIISTEELNAALTDIELKYALERSDIAKQEQEAKQQALLDTVSMYSSMAMTVTDIVGNLAQVQLNNIEKRKQREIEEVKASNKNAKEKQRLIEEINKKSEEESKKAANIQKGMAITQAIINGALGITEIWSKHAANPILAGILTGLETALVASQIAVIASQKFALGGDFITNGRQNITVGDNPGGRERVQITPLSSPNINGPQQAPNVDMSLIVYGNVDRDAAEIINRKREEQLLEFKSMYKELQYTGQL